jgi:hypothetical protein
MPANRKANESRRLTVAGLIAVTTATLLMMGWAIFPTSAVGVEGNCPTGAPWVQVQGDSGSGTIGGGVTISWSGDTVTVSGGSATICVKAGNNNSGVLTNFGPGTYTMTCAVFGCNPQGMLPGISHVQWIPITTTTTTTVPTTTTTVPTTTTTVPTTTTTVPTTTTTVPTTTTTVPTTTTTVPTTTTTVPGGGGGGGTTTVPVTTTTTPTVGPTTVQPSTTTKSPNVAPTTVSPRGTAFTGVENVVPIGAIALMLMTSGTGLLWAGSRRKRDQNQHEE